MKKHHYNESNSMSFFSFFFFSPYILGHSQFGLYVFVTINFISIIFQFTINLIPTVNLLTENVHVANDVHN